MTQMQHEPAPPLRLRSPLFAPGDSARKCEKALASAADAVILDLEDSVAAPAKEAARMAVAARLASVGRGGVVVRVNPRDTPFHLADLAAVVPGRPAAIMLPKASGSADLAALDRQIEVLETAHGLPPRGIGVLLIVETAAGVLALGEYAGAAPRLRALCFGAEDLAADLGVTTRGAGGAYPAPVAQARATLLLAAAAAGVIALDTPFPDPRDPDGLAREAATASVDGFAGKLCIHPDQIAAVNAAFTPEPARLAWARAVRDGFAERPGAGVFTLDGKMIDRPHLVLARRILAAAGE